MKSEIISGPDSHILISTLGPLLEERNENEAEL